MNREQLFERIAKDTLHIDTLKVRNSDDKDFHDVAVWEIKAALQAAYDAGASYTNYKDSKR